MRLAKPKHTHFVAQTKPHVSRHGLPREPRPCNKPAASLGRQELPTSRAPICMFPWRLEGRRIVPKGFQQADERLSSLHPFCCLLNAGTQKRQPAQTERVQPGIPQPSVPTSPRPCQQLRAVHSQACPTILGITTCCLVASGRLNIYILHAPPGKPRD